MDELKVTTSSAEETERVGEMVGRHLRAGDLVALTGPLGAGKTCFVRGLARAMGVDGRVASPSFIIARHHPGPTPLVHADAYRLDDPEELVWAGLDEWLRSAAVALEWADRAGDVLPDDGLDVQISNAGPNRRLIHLRARGPRGREILEALRQSIGEGSG